MRHTEIEHPEQGDPRNFKPNTGRESISTKGVEEETDRMSERTLGFLLQIKHTQG